MMVEETRQVFPGAQILVADDPEGRGKGWAIREKLKEAQGSLIAFIDGDLDIHPGELEKLISPILEADICVGVKCLADLTPKRRVLSWGYRLFVKLLFGLPISDTQTGVKLFKRYALPEWECDGFSFDVEILARAHSKGFKIAEAPIKAKVSGTKSLYQTFWMIWETMKIWGRVRL